MADIQCLRHVVTSSLGCFYRQLSAVVKGNNTVKSQSVMHFCGGLITQLTDSILLLLMKAVPLRNLYPVRIYT
jgi:hypothetical protein